MMDKVAHDAFSQGAYDALQAMDVPQHIKVAAAQHLTKEANKVGIGKRLGNLILGTRGNELGLRELKRIENVQAKMAPGAQLKMAPLMEALKADRVRAAKGLGVTGVGLTGLGLGANALLGEEEAPPAPPVVEAPPAPAPELGMMDQLGNYGSDLLDRAQRGELSNSELATLAGAGVLGTGALAYGLS